MDQDMSSPRNVSGYLNSYKQTSMRLSERGVTKAQPSHPLQKHSNSLPNSVGRSNRSQSIPISNTIRRTASEHQMSQDEAEADYKDYLFYSRVVHGISRKQEHYQNGHLKYENELSLNNIMRTRNDAMLGKASHNRYNSFLTSCEGHENTILYNPFPPMDPAEHEAYDAGIFELDL